MHWEEALVWREKAVSNHTSHFIGSYVVLSFDRKSKVVVIDQDSENKRRTMTQIHPFLAEPNVDDDSIKQDAFEHEDKDVTGDICQAERILAEVR